MKAITGATLKIPLISDEAVNIDEEGLLPSDDDTNANMVHTDRLAHSC